MTAAPSPESISTNTPENRPPVVELEPSFKIPLVIVAAGLCLAFIQLLVGVIVASFGLFLMFQAATLRLQFTPTDLDIYRSGDRIRRFPYAEWQNWRIFWTRVPILFYFKEINSIHFLPIIFDPRTLQQELTARCPRQD